MSSDKFKAVAPEMMFGIADTIAHHRGLVQFFLQLLGKIRVQDENKITLHQYAYLEVHPTGLMRP
jgi:hypothetical protein